MDPTTLPMPRARQQCVATLVDALATGAIDLGPDGDWAHARAQLLALPGIGPWTVEMIALRGFGDPDAFPATDLGVRHGAAHLGIAAGERALVAHAERWRPWRAYAVQHLWAALDHPINHWPPRP